MNPLFGALDDFIAQFSDFSFRLSGSVISSLIIMAIIAILAIIVGIQAKVQDPMKRPKGLLLVVESFVAWLDDWTESIMDRPHGSWPGYYLCLFVYLFMAFTWSLTGLPSVIDYFLCPLCLSLVMFIIIQATGLRYQKMRYFHRYIEPFPFWLPINMITMWTPIISTSLRMFGNCLAGSVIIGLVSWVSKNLSLAIFGAIGNAGQVFIAPIIIAVLNLYFGLFSGYIQTLVFASLNGVWIGAEIPESDSMGVRVQATRPSEDKA